MFILELLPISHEFPGGNLSYLSKENIKKGTLVSAPFRKGVLVGMVLETKPVQDFKQNLKQQKFQLKSIAKVIEGQIFSEAYLESIFELSEFWHIDPGALIRLSAPKKIRSGELLFSQEADNQKKKKTQEVYLMKNFKERILFFIQEYREKKGGMLQIVCPSAIHKEKVREALLEEGISHKEIFNISAQTSLKKIHEIKNTLKTNKAILLTTPLFLDTFSNNETTLVLEKESSRQYERAVEPILDMRILVEHFAKKKCGKIIYADVILRPERLSQTTNKNWENDFFQNKKITIYNQKKQGSEKESDQERIDSLTNKKTYSLVHKKILEQIKQDVQQGKKVFCFVARKNLGTNILCSRCGSLATSPDSGSPYRLSQQLFQGKKQNIFLTKEGERREAFDTCALCGGLLQSFGIGTETIQKFFTEQGIKSEIFDAEHAKNKGEKEKRLKEQVLVGTSLALPYLQHFDTFYILSLDSLFSKMSYSADFEALYLISQILEFTDTLAIQTRNVLEKKLPLLQNKDFKGYIEKESTYAKKYLLPPERVILEITHRGNQDELHKWQKYYQKEIGTFISHTRFFYEQSQLKMSMYLECSKEDWNTKHQNKAIKHALPKQSKTNTLHINPKAL